MKKILSLILTMITALSVLFAIPVSAEVGVWPYFFADFESGLLEGTEQTQGGAEGSLYAAKVTSERLFLMSGGEVPENSRIKFSADVKLAEPADKDYFEIVMPYLAAKNKNFVLDGNLSFGGKTPKIHFDKKITQWQNLNCEFLYEDADVLVEGVYLDFAGIDGLCIDNVKLYIEKEPAGGTPSNRIMYQSSFEEGLDGFYLGTEDETKILETAETKNAPDGNRVLQITDNDESGHIFLYMPLTEVLKRNHTYLIEYDARIAEGRDAADPSGEPYTSKTPCTHRWFCGSGYVDLYALFVSNDWRTVRYYISPDVNIFPGDFKLQWWIQRQVAGSDVGVYQIDDFKIYDYGTTGFENGNMEVGYADGQRLGFNGLTKEDYPADGTGWMTEANARIAYNSASAAMSNDKTRSATMYFDSLTENNKVYQEANLIAGRTYRITGHSRAADRGSATRINVTASFEGADTVIASEVNPNDLSWVMYDGTFTVPGTAGKTVKTVIGVSAQQADANDPRQNTSRFDEKGAISIYTDNWELTLLPTDNVPAIKATAHTSEDMTVSFDISGNYNSTVVKLVAQKDGKKTYIGSCNGTSIKIPDAFVNGYDIGAQITPVSANGYVGEEIYVDVSETPVVDTSVIRIKVNGEFVKPDSAPTIVNDRTLVPIRAVAEKLGYDVNWDGATRTAIISDDITTLKITIDKAVMEKITESKSEEVAIDVAAQIINDRTYLPLRAIGEALGASVDWDAAGRIVIVNNY